MKVLLTFILKGNRVRNKAQKLWVLTNTGTEVFVSCSSGNSAWINRKSCHCGSGYALVQLPWAVLESLSLEILRSQPGKALSNLLWLWSVSLPWEEVGPGPQVLPGQNFSMLLCFLDSFLTSSLWGDLWGSSPYTRTKLPSQYLAFWKN